MMQQALFVYYSWLFLAIVGLFVLINIADMQACVDFTFAKKKSSNYNVKGS